MKEVVRAAAVRWAFWLLVSLFCKVGAAGATAAAAYSQTTLEQAMNLAYNAKVRDGTWASIFGRDSLRSFRAVSFCTGSVDNWPLPEVKPDSDLERVIRDGVFKCGHLIKLNFGTPEGEVIFRTSLTEGNNTVEGYAVEWMEGLVEELGKMYDTEITLEWLLTDGSQASLEALQNGEIDAGCAVWASDGTWKDESDQSVARGLAFSVQTCPTYVETEYIYVTVNSTINSWADLVEQMNAGTVTRLCASTSPGAGTETNCQNTLNQYTTEPGQVVCNGVNEESFPQLLAGNCSATWTGFPTENVDQFKSFPMPAATARVTLFRAADFTNMQIIGDPYHADGGRYYERTTLEQAVTRAFNMKVLDGSYAATFGGLTDIEAVSFCSGSVDSWPLPKAVVPGSDLEAVLDRGVFRCGYRNNQIVSNKDGDIMLDTSGETVTGLVADFFSNSLIPAFGQLYNKTVSVEWVLSAFEVATLNQLSNGEIDSACGLWDPDGVYVLGQEVVARPLAFNTMYCPMYLATENIYTLAYSDFDALIAGVISGAVKTICVADDVTSGKVNTCTSTMIEYTNGTSSVECTGSTSTELSANDEAFRRLSEDICQAVWSGSVPASLNATTSYISFSQPTVLAPVSLFRTFDASSVQSDSPTTSPVPAEDNGGGDGGGGGGEAPSTTTSAAAVGRVSFLTSLTAILILSMATIGVDTLSWEMIN